MKKIIELRSEAKNYQHLATDASATGAILVDIFKSRGASFRDQEQYSLQALLPPDTLKGLEAALVLLVNALEKKQRILIVGDFDADGATSTALAVSCLQAFGCSHVDFLVPNRFIFGYGLTPEIVELACEREPDLIVTVDNGISSVDGVKAANAHNIKVLVTDHHLPGRQLPDAEAIVNPNQLGCEFPSKNLAGVGVIFYLMLALRKRLREINWFSSRNLTEPNLAQYLDLVALGTVADVVPLDENNRILVAAGLQRMRAGKARAGIKALLHIAGKDAARISSSDLGFALGPRINAAGRLDDMSLGIQCLLSEGAQQAHASARELDDLNRDRKSIEGAMQQEALKVLEKFSDQEIDGSQHGVCLYQSDWHQGVIGILASRIKDRLHRPTIVFADADSVTDTDTKVDNSQKQLKGSGRSIAGVHLRDILDEIATANPGLIEKFGGHAMAAGMSIRKGQLDTFVRCFNVTVEKYLSPELIQPLVLSDGELPQALIRLDVADAIQNAGPWGQHFPQPLFHGNFHIVQHRIVGEKHLKLTVSCEAYTNIVFDAIAFNVDTDIWPNPQAREVRLVYQLDVNEYRGKRKVQLLVQYIEVSL